jgi:hypothetical protein
MSSPTISCYEIHDIEDDLMQITRHHDRIRIYTNDVDDLSFSLPQARDLRDALTRLIGDDEPKPSRDAQIGTAVRDIDSLLAALRDLLDGKAKSVSVKINI